MSAQVRRVIRILVMLSSGERLSTTELIHRLDSQHDEVSVSKRQLQRDLRAMEAAGIPLDVYEDGKTPRYGMPKFYQSLVTASVDKYELLALYSLKGVLSAMKHTRIERDLTSLRSKLNALVPGELFLRSDITAEVSPGRYMNAIDDRTMTQIVDAIIDPHWDRVTYRSAAHPEGHTFVVSFCRLLNHAGRLYVAAWHPRYQTYITLAVDAIVHVERANDVMDPLHEFQELTYVKSRFGVYSGDVETIVLSIKPEAVRFFRNREWHPTQQFSLDDNGRGTLTMSVPLSPELLSWVLGWADSIRVTAPPALIDLCKKKIAEIGSW